MNGKTADNKNLFQKEDYTTYHCPHCGEPFAEGILVNIKVICSHCNKFFVMVGLAQGEDWGDEEEQEGKEQL